MDNLRSIDILLSELEEFNSDIRVRLREKGINNTGAASESLRVQRTEKGAASMGNDYIYFLEYGRGSGKFPPVTAMRDWVRTKLGVTEPKEVNRIAYLVGRKIATEGTAIHNDRKKGIQLYELIPKFLVNLQKKINAYITERI